MKRLKGLVLAMVAVMLCVTTMVAGTFALFTDSAKITNHLQSGALDVSLSRVEATRTILNEEGYLEEKKVGGGDFSNANSENLFGLTSDEKIVPGSVLTADMRIANDSDVAFGYYIQFILSTDSQKISADTLAEQLKITIIGDEEVSAKLSDGLTLGSEDDFVAVVGVGESKEFTVKVEFVNDAIDTSVDNNDAMSQNVYVDFVVMAVQQLSK